MCPPEAGCVDVKMNSRPKLRADTSGRYFGLRERNSFTIPD